MPDRVMRSIAPEKYQPSAKAGIARKRQSRNQNGSQLDASSQRNVLVPLPRTGSQPRSTPKTMISTRPTKNPGIDSPSRAIILPALSQVVPTFSAEIMPSGTPIASEIAKAANPSFSELGSRSK